MVKNTPSSSSLRNSYISLPHPASEAAARIAALEAQVAEFAKAKREIEERAAAMEAPLLSRTASMKTEMERAFGVSDFGSMKGHVKTKTEEDKVKEAGARVAEEAVATQLAEWLKEENMKGVEEKAEEVQKTEETEKDFEAFFESERLRALKEGATQERLLEERESQMAEAKATETAAAAKGAVEEAVRDKEKQEEFLLKSIRDRRHQRDAALDAHQGQEFERLGAEARAAGHKEKIDQLRAENEYTTQWLADMHQEEAAANIHNKAFRKWERKPTQFEIARQKIKEKEAMIINLEKAMKNELLDWEIDAGEISSEKNGDILSDAELDALENIQKAIEKETENEKPATADNETIQYTAADGSTRWRSMPPSREPIWGNAKKKFLERKVIHEQMPYPRFTTCKRAESSSASDIEATLRARDEMLEQMNASKTTDDSLWSPQLSYKRASAILTGFHSAETTTARAGKNQPPRGYCAIGKDAVPESSDSPKVVYKRADGTETARMVPATFPATFPAMPNSTGDLQFRRPFNQQIQHVQKTMIDFHGRPTLSRTRLNLAKDPQQPKSLFEGYSQETMNSSPLGLDKQWDKSLFEKFTDELEARKRKGDSSSLIAKGLVKEKERELEEFAIKDPAAYTKPFCDFLTENPTVFHAVAHFEERLGKAGFVKLSERKTWDGLVKGGKYFVNRNGSSLIIFTVGSGYKSGNGVAMIAGHVDSLTAKLKPISNKKTTAGYVQLGIAPYAGALNSTWWDRDLGVGGRVLVKDGKGKIVTKLVKLGWPIARIPTLAPHFGIGMTGHENKETELVPIVGLDNSESSSLPEFANLTLGGGDAGSFAVTQPPRLVRAIAGELSITDYSSIVNWELELYDTQPAQTIGLDKEFISGGRIDDKLCSWAAVEALLASSTSSASGSEGEGGIIKLVGLFDDEEIGNNLRQGAKGNLLPSVIERVAETFSSSGSSANILAQTYANSFLISADVIHAVNPNFLGSYLENHAPRLNVGLVVEADSNGHMTTDSVSTALLSRVAEKNGDKLQMFMIRNDSRSGGTVGPELSTKMGVRSIDAGLCQLSMHSIRATTGSLDPGLGVKVFKGFFDHFEAVDKEFE